MFDILTILAQSHDLRFVALAAIICGLSAFACISVLNHARRSKGWARGAWTAVAGVAVGFGIWATHFVAMLAFDPGFSTGYDISVTLLSLAIAIVVCGCGLWVAVSGTRKADSALGGAIVGLGITTMHYTGMFALQLGGEIVWDWNVATISVAFGMGLGAMALLVGTGARRLTARAIGAGLLTLAVVSMHFTAMGAANFDNCFSVVPPNEISADLLSLSVGLVSILILLLALGGVFLDLRDRKRNRMEMARMRDLVDAAVEGLLVCDGRTIVTVNASFLRMLGVGNGAVLEQEISAFIPPTACISLFEGGNGFVETELTAENGQTIPVEVISRQVEFGGSQHHAVAVRDLRARRQAESDIRYLAHHDSMTGLANRTSFNMRLEAEIENATRLGQRFAVMWLDLDRFKEINDLFGHAAGDALLKRVAEVMSNGLTGHQFAARLGGDEFALILPDMPGAERARQAAQSLLDYFEKSNETINDGTMISASIGIALFPDDSRDAEQLMNFADTALYCAKQDGRGTFRFFETRMSTDLRNRRQLEHDLRLALGHEQLFLVYQPQVDLATGEVSGFEALLRWNHKVRGPISPGEFIPVAEESGLVIQIGEWVLRRACAEAASWANPLSVAVNVSAVQLHCASFASFLHEVLVETGLSPARLEIEITETALIRDMSRALSSLRKIKALGVRVAMDDFGTGYSSLSNLRAFPFDRIKVDQSFVRAIHTNNQSATIVRAVLELGRGLKLPILAEGVEDPAELEFLRDAVCDSAQGFWPGYPSDISVYEDIVNGTETRVPTGVRAEKLKASA